MDIESLIPRLVGPRGPQLKGGIVGRRRVVVAHLKVLGCAREEQRLALRLERDCIECDGADGCHCVSLGCQMFARRRLVSTHSGLANDEVGPGHDPAPAVQLGHLLKLFLLNISAPIVSTLTEMTRLVEVEVFALVPRRIFLPGVRSAIVSTEMGTVPFMCDQLCISLI